MLIYATLSDFLHKRPCPSDESTLQLRGCDRPFLVLEPGEELVQKYYFLMQHSSNVYEIGFPWVQITDWKSHHQLSQDETLTLKSGLSRTISLTDEVLDETQLSNDEDAAQQLQNELGERCDRTTAETITLFIGLFDAMLGNRYQGETKCPVVSVPDYIVQRSAEEARLPLVLALNRRYELRHKLELIASKLRSQLSRVAEMMPLGHIQEMDAYCLRDYVRRPGHNAVEKAGARQELMGIQRYQNFNTPENRFLKGFCNLLHLDCRDYRDRYPEAKALEMAIDRFRQEPATQNIPRTTAFAGKPNYVLQQNPIYRSFYQAYLDYLKRRTDKEKLWGYRQFLLVDVVAMLLGSVLLNLEGSYVAPLTDIDVLGTPDDGRYLPTLTQPLTIQCFLKTAILTFCLARSSDQMSGDLSLKIRTQSLTSEQQRIDSLDLKIWVFWYKPSVVILDDMTHLSGNENSFCIYLDDVPGLEKDSPPDTALESTDSSSDKDRMITLQLPHPVNETLEDGMLLLSHEICQLLGRILP